VFSTAKKAPLDCKKVNQSYKLNQAANICALIPIIGNVAAFILQSMLSQLKLSK
jgi:hypothetical protein